MLCWRAVEEDKGSTAKRGGCKKQESEKTVRSERDPALKQIDQVFLINQSCR